MTSMTMSTYIGLSGLWMAMILVNVYLNIYPWQLEYYHDELAYSQKQIKQSMILYSLKLNTYLFKSISGIWMKTQSC